MLKFVDDESSEVRESPANSERQELTTGVIVRADGILLLAGGTAGRFKAIGLSFALTAQAAPIGFFILLVARAVIEGSMRIDPHLYARVSLKVHERRRGFSDS
jgi:hypothetical protein